MDQSSQKWKEKCLEQLGQREERNGANRCLFKPQGSVGGAGFFGNVGWDQAQTFKGWKALIHLGAFREQILAWRLSLRWFSLKIGINSLMEPAWSASSLLPRGVMVFWDGSFGSREWDSCLEGIFPARSCQGGNFCFPKSTLGACRKLHFCHCSARPSTKLLPRHLGKGNPRSGSFSRAIYLL